MYDPRRNYAFDRGMVVWFREPNSYTGEDMAELHVHGAPAVIQATLTALRGFPDVQPASAGAFTKRALVHGKMDVSQVEALGDLIQADSLNGLALAVTNLNGALRRQRDLWRAQLQEALAILEAVLEFGDEHLEQETEEQLSEATARIRAVQQEIRTQVRLASPDGRQPALTLTPRVVLYGRANAGKSSLFNVLGQREASIVHATPGTTRDVIEQRAFIDGLAVTLLDTAGLREAPSSDGGIEAEGIRRARSLVQQTSLRILVHDLSDPSKDAAEALTERGLEPSAVVLHKADLMRDVEARVEARRALQRRYPGASLFFVSSRTSEGVDSLLDWLGARLRNQVDATHQADGQRLLVQTQRQQALLGVVHDVLDDALRNISVPELAVEQVRLSLQYFAEMIGDGDRRFDAEEMLTRIFSRFCIGK
jgi:tRNA modification GTPase